jgi:glycosyltransferase involved in cell wall biosynthesis
VVRNRLRGGSRVNGSSKGDGLGAKSPEFRILHVISGLRTGGAEMMLLKLIASSPCEFEHRVISLADGGPIRDRIRDLGIPVVEVGLERGLLRLLKMPQILRAAAKWRPNVIQGWMYHGSLFASLIALTSGRLSLLAWNIRQTLYSLRDEKMMTRLVIMACAAVSRMPRLIIYNTVVGRSQHAALGFDDRRGIVIANGFETGTFTPDSVQRFATRASLQIPQDATVIGIVARYHPMKDHATFLRACSLAAPAIENCRFIVVGKGCDSENEALVKLAKRVGIESQLFLLGERDDLHKIYPALDVFCLTSAWGEGFPNAVGEAMSCGLPCVVTDVGDCGYVVGGHGVVVPPRRPDLIASAIVRLTGVLEFEREQAATAARRRIQEQFKIESIADAYFKNYRLMIGRQSRVVG